MSFAVSIGCVPDPLAVVIGATAILPPSRDAERLDLDDALDVLDLGEVLRRSRCGSA